MSIVRALIVLSGLLFFPTFAAEGDFNSGPDVGESIPRFELSDQHGNPRDIDSLAGPNGLLLLFYRTADW